MSEPITFSELTLGTSVISAKTEKKMIVISHANLLITAFTTM